ncbi:uncharacterized protein GIQ15_04307 [Arthroderma uncinatum]|uniref:uncharacterized protein n=1 Tax=Arthroderma uncinatum TaxID=74035 RepID=UPI00144A71D9|nr:uncharacterized protein GIQ15_04307 [Arthroderma uncinatum]KAF3481548.1 hypothetical protein GIQ15_04307 [Arthroderma uncinatum]
MDPRQPTGDPAGIFRFSGQGQGLPPHPEPGPTPTTGIPSSGLFDYLRNVDWSNVTCCPRPSFASSPCAVFQIPVFPSDSPLGQRLTFLEAFTQSQGFIQGPSSAFPATDLLDLSINLLARRVLSDPRIAQTFTFEKNLLQTDEVLLINPSYSFDAGDSGVTFESALRVWLCPVVGLDQICQRLSGLTRMILDLARTEARSEERKFLAAAISLRVRQVLGAPLAPGTPDDDTQAFPSSARPLFSMMLADGEKTPRARSSVARDVPDNRLCPTRVEHGKGSLDGEKDLRPLWARRMLSPITISTGIVNDEEPGAILA